MSQGTRLTRTGLTAGVIVFVALLCLTACGSNETARATPTPTLTSRVVPLVPTMTNTPQPTATPTFTPQPTASPTPLPTETPTAEPGPTDTPSSPPAGNVCPLTGLTVSDPALLERRPLAIKVQNAEASRPQYGLPQADIVYEHLTEGTITRLTAIYLCQNAGRVGSVRSARFIDLEIPAMYKSIMVFSGTSPGLYPMFLESDFKDRQFVQNWGLNAEAFFRDTQMRKSGVPIEHTLFVDVAKLWQTAERLGLNQRQDLDDMTFDATLPAGGQPATHVHIPYPSRMMVVDWRYDVGLGAYLRWNGGVPFVDAVTGEQIRAANVVVLYATHVDADFYESGTSPSVQIQLWGTGPAVIFRDGQAFPGLWARLKREDMVVFRDSAGQVPIPLKPGNSWFELVPLPGHRWSFEATWDAEGR